jgi:hypothetical protein
MSAPTQTQPPPNKLFVSSYGDLALYTASAIAMLVLGFFGWLAGGYFTLVALGALLAPWGVQVGTTGWAWAIPVFVSVIEVATFRFRERLPHWTLGIGMLVTALDFFSTVYGIVIVIGGWELKFFTGFTVPGVFNEHGEMAPVPVTFAMVLAAVLTFAPEQIILNALGMLHGVARGLWKSWRAR